MWVYLMLVCVFKRENTFLLSLFLNGNSYCSRNWNFLSAVKHSCCWYSTGEIWGLDLRTSIHRGWLLRLGFSQPPQIGKNAQLRKWAESERMALRRRKVIFPVCSKIRKWKEPAGCFFFFLTVIYRCTRLESRLAVKRKEQTTLMVG